MTNIKHLTNNQLIAYNNGSLERGESHTIGKHLLKCPECRKKLPLPSVEKFWSALLSENEIDEKPKNERPIDEKTWFSFLPGIPAFWNLNSNLVFGCAALVMLSSISIFIWLNISTPPPDVVQSFEVNDDFRTKLEFPKINQIPPKTTPDNSSNGKNLAPTPIQKKQDSNLSKSPMLQNKVSRDAEKKNPVEKPQNVVSTTRGVSANCSKNREVEIELSLNKENLVFKWKKVPKAAKYHLYISDDDEILIDEFETDTETTFVLKKTLDPLKTYKWKIIVTLESGQTVAGPSNKFTVKDFQNKQMKSEKTRNADVRCSANS